MVYTYNGIYVYKNIYLYSSCICVYIIGSYGSKCCVFHQRCDMVLRKEKCVSTPLKIPQTISGFNPVILPILHGISLITNNQHHLTQQRGQKIGRHEYKTGWKNGSAKITWSYKYCLFCLFGFWCPLVPVVSKKVSGVRWSAEYFGSFGTMESPSTWNHHGILAFPKHWSKKLHQIPIESIIQDNPRFEMHVPSGNALCVSTPKKITHA